jgi:hypothetical protein
MARDIAKTEAYVTSRHQSGQVKTLFACLKRISKLDRLRLRGPNGARDEFRFNVEAQNLRKLAELIPPSISKIGVKGYTSRHVLTAGTLLREQYAPFSKLSGKSLLTAIKRAWLKAHQTSRR